MLEFNKISILIMEWNMKKYDESLILKLQKKKRTINNNGLEIIIKESPLLEQEGYLDPIEKSLIGNNWAGPPEGGELPPLEFIIPIIRDSMGFANLNLNTEEMITKYEALEFDGNTVELWRYFKRRSDRAKKPCLVYYHGGGWVGGTPYTTENPCKFIAELADAVVFNIGYSLAPEKPYPNGLNDCYSALKHIYENSKLYGIDKDRITVAGDSAGGNYAAAVTLKARDENIPMVYQQILIYPAVAMADIGVSGYEWNENEFVMSKEEEDLIRPCLGLGRPAKYGTDPMVLAYINNQEDLNNPYVSPMVAEHIGLPKTIIVVAEYDGLRIQGEFYAGQLRDAGVDVEVIRYNGVTHAFLDKLGYLTQSEDLCREIADAVR